MRTAWRDKIRYVVAGIVIASMALSLFAHHSTTAVYDITKKVTIAGTLTGVEWVNPHIAVLIDVKDGRETKSWKLETNPPSWFQRINLERQNFAKAIGQTVVVEANPARDGSFSALLMNIKFEDGTSVEVIPDRPLSRRNRTPE
jgi:Family of unknown function (DUF6152)